MIEYAATGPREPMPDRHPEAILDYAPTAPPDPLRRRVRAVTMVLAWIFLCGLIGWAAEPRRYRAVGLLQVNPPQSIPLVAGPPFNVNEIEARQAAAVKGLASPANLNAAITLLPQPAIITPADIAATLTVQAVPDSRLVSVIYEHDDAQSAAAVVNALMGAWGTAGAATAVAAPAAVPLRPQRNMLYPTGGMAVGLLLGVFIVAMRAK